MACGLSFDGYDKNNKEQWERIQAVRIINVET